jgi:hypothetical protein
MNTEEMETNRIAAREIARQLKEISPQAMIQIERIINYLGVDTAHELLQKALQIEDEGGMLTTDGKRRRTPGGVYFHLVREATPAEIHRVIWAPTPGHPARPKPQQQPRGEQQPAVKPPPRPRPAGFAWHERGTILAEALRRPGESSVKISLVGIPGKMVERGDVIVAPMVCPQAPPTPRELPHAPNELTMYVVYMTRRQWERVEQALEDDDDRLMVEGYPFTDRKLGVVAVLAQQVTTSKLLRAKRESQRAGSDI